MPTIDVLLVDDNDMIRCAVSVLLHDEGFDVTACSSGSAALEMVKSRSFQVYIVDYRLPGMKGDAITRELRKADPDALIIGSSIEPHEHVFLAAGADLFVLKENLHTDLAACIREQLPPA